MIEPARRRPQLKFLIGGALYPEEFPWERNIYFVRHLPPGEHPAFFASSRMTLNVTRADMARMGWCPSGRMFEAAACEAPVLTDSWEGLETFFAPGSEVLVPVKDFRQAKLRLAYALNQVLEARKLSQADAARVLRVTQPKVSALRHYKLAGFSVERLMNLLTALDQDVQIVIRRKPRSRKGGRITVVAA